MVLPKSMEIFSRPPDHEEGKNNHVDYFRPIIPFKIDVKNNKNIIGIDIMHA